MSLSRRPPPNSDDLKHRVVACLNKLSDRDTVAVASTELDSIARDLTHDTFSPFITFLSATDSSDKSPVRKQCVRLLGTLSATHGDALAPHLSKMLSSVLLRRLRDPDSAVRSACVDSASSMAAQITKPAFFFSFAKPLFELILHEQDQNSQIGAAICLAAAIDAAPDPEPAQLQKVLPKLWKLAKSDSFKAKPALLSVLGSIVGAGGVCNRNALNCLIPCLVEFLSSNDWGTRKAAAEALAKVALTKSNVLSQFKSSVLTSLEARRFDKIKVVRETMNRALELWKVVPGVSEEVLTPAKSKSSSIDIDSGGYSSVSKGPRGIGKKVSHVKKVIPTSMSPPSDGSSTTTTQKRSPPQSNRKPIAIPSEWKIEIAVPHTPAEVACEDDDSKSFGASGSGSGSADCESGSNIKPETKRVIFNKSCDVRSHGLGGSRFRSRVVPGCENDNCELDVAGGTATEDVYWNHKEVEDLSLIQKQLLQIENQQSSLLSLLQRFIGSSQSGISSLETRVNGLEKALDEMSYDLAVSTGRISSTNSAGNTCCMLPGAEFLSPKFWRTGGQYSTSRFFSGKSYSPAAMCSMRDKDFKGEMFELDSPRGLQQSGVGSVVNSPGGIRRETRGCLESSNKMPRKIIQDGGSFSTCIRQQI